MPEPTVRLLLTSTPKAVATPTLPTENPRPTFNSPPETLTPLLAVTTPTESTLVTSS